MVETRRACIHHILVSFSVLDISLWSKYITLVFGLLLLQNPVGIPEVLVNGRHNVLSHHSHMSNTLNESTFNDIDLFFKVIYKCFTKNKADEF